MNSTDLIPDNELAHLSWWLKAPMVIYLLTIHLFGVSSNIVVAIIYVGEPSKSACDWLILTMSITDAFVCFCSPVLYLRSCLRIPIPWNDSFVCTLEYYLQLTAMFASCLLLAIIALDRYAKICRPDVLSLTPTMARNVCVMTVLVSAVICLVPFFGGILDSHCYISEIRKTIVTKIFFTSMFCCFVLSFCIVTFAYASVCKKISQKIKLKQKLIENNGLLSAEQENKQEKQPHCPRLWHQILPCFPAKQNKHKIQSKASNELIYLNGNLTAVGESSFNLDKANDVDHNEKTGYVNTDLKISLSEAEITRNGTDNLSDKCLSRWETSGAETAVAMEAHNLHYTVVDEHTCVDFTNGTDHTAGLDSEELQVSHSFGEITDGVFLRRYYEQELTRTDSGHNDDTTSLLPLQTGSNAVDSMDPRVCLKEVIDPKGCLKEIKLTDYSANSLTPKFNREPSTHSHISFRGEFANVYFHSMLRVSVSDSNLLRTKRYFEINVLGNSVDKLQQKENDLVLKPNKGNKSRQCRSFHLLPQPFNARTRDITRANSCPNIGVTNCQATGAHFCFFTSDSCHSSLQNRNSKTDSDSTKNILANNINPLISNQPNNTLGCAASGVPSSYTTCCTRCVQHPPFSAIADEVCFRRLATHGHCKRLVRSEPCFSMLPNYGLLDTRFEALTEKMDISSSTSDAPCIYRTNYQFNEESTILHQLPRQSQSLHHNLRRHSTACPQKNVSSCDSPKTPRQFQLGSIVSSHKDMLKQTDEIQQDHDYLETDNIFLRRPQTPSALKSRNETQLLHDYSDTTDATSALLHQGTETTLKPTDETHREQNYLETTEAASVLLDRPRAPSSLKPTGSTSSRRSNKSSSFADPVKISLMEDNSYMDDKSEVVSFMSTSPFRKPRRKGGCRTSGRSRSSVRSSTSSKSRFARERQMTFMLLSVTAAFLLSWIPPWVMYISCLYGPLEYLKSSVIQYLATIHLLNYVASPVIYFTFNPTFRSKVSQLFTPPQKYHCCQRKEPSPPESPDHNSSPI